MTNLLIDILNLINESTVCVGSGVLGLLTVMFNGSISQYLEYIGFTLVGTGIFVKLLSDKAKHTVNHNNLVIITGCDSGLGFNLAMHCYDMNMFVIATCLSRSSEGARELQECCGKSKRFFLLEMDIRKSESVHLVEDTVSKFLKHNTDLTLINNAGVMTFGEFEWQTESLIKNQIDVNLMGTMKFTKAFLPLIRYYKARIITVTSHCSLEALPGLATYAASKVGLRFWCDSLRVEMKQYGVHVINFIPGSFVMLSNIMANQERHAKEMRDSFSDEQLQFYGDYFNRYNSYLSALSGYKQPSRMKNADLLRQFECALLDVDPYSLYKHEPWRYKFYHFLFTISPVYVRDWLILKFMNMPKFSNVPMNSFMTT